MYQNEYGSIATSFHLKMHGLQKECVKLYNSPSVGTVEELSWGYQIAGTAATYISYYVAGSHYLVHLRIIYSAL